MLSSLLLFKDDQEFQKKMRKTLDVAERDIECMIEAEDSYWQRTGGGKNPVRENFQVKKSN